MGIHKINLFMLALLVCTFSTTNLAQGEIAGREYHFLAMNDSPGLCVLEVHPRVVRFRVESKERGWETVIWEGLPQVGDYIDTLGADKVSILAFYSFPPGEHQLVGIGVKVTHAQYPANWSKRQRMRVTNTIRTQNPDWDFTFRDRGMSFEPCVRRANEANYRVREKWGGPRSSRAECKAVEGRWNWFNRGHVDLQPGGVAKGFDATGREGNNGTWRCLSESPVTIEITWPRGGWRDTLKLAPDGQRLEGKNQQNARVWAERPRQSQPAGCRSVVGSWKWFNVERVVLDSHGGAIAYSRGTTEANRGTWRCLSESPVTIEITWTRASWRDTLTLGADGRRLEGKNQVNARVWGERIQ